MELPLIDVLLIQKCTQNKIKRTVICYKFNMKIPIKKAKMFATKASKQHTTSSQSWQMLYPGMFLSTSFQSQGQTTVLLALLANTRSGES